MSKPFYQSKEVWVGVIAILNTISHYLGGPSLEPTPELLSAIVGLLVAIRVFFTASKLSLRNGEKA